jgi:N,N'-diacetyllegionaminate synthase
MTTVHIGKNSIGQSYPPFIVAEVGINHNGELANAFEMVEVAKRAGADAVKFQTFRAEEFVGDPEQTYTYKSQGKEITESMLEMFKRYEFSKDEWFDIKKKCDQADIMFLSTPQNRSDLDLLLEIGIPAIKVGSDDFTNLSLLRDYATSGLPIIVSTGMSDLGEVYQALETLGALDGYPTILLVCTSQYPTPPEDVNLLKLITLTKTFPMVVTGFSDHTMGSMASSLAVAMRACFFEKHFTLDHNLPGPDHWFSEDPVGLKEWVGSIREAYTMMGESIVRATKPEEAMKKIARRSIVAIRDISPGENLTLSNIGLRRPGNGFPPAFLDKVLESKATQKIPMGRCLCFGDFK